MATIGRPDAAASIAARGWPSRCDGQHEHVEATEQPVDVVAMTEQHDAGGRGPSEHRRVEGVGPVAIWPADDDEADAGTEVGDRLEQLGVALLGDQSTDRPDDDRLAVDAPRRAELGTLDGAEDIGTEPLEVDAVAEVAQLAARRRGGAAA